MIAKINNESSLLTTPQALISFTNHAFIKDRSTHNIKITNVSALNRNNKRHYSTDISLCLLHACTREHVRSCRQ